MDDYLAVCFKRAAANGAPSYWIVAFSRLLPSQKDSEEPLTFYGNSCEEALLAAIDGLAERILSNPLNRS